MIYIFICSTNTTIKLDRSLTFITTNTYILLPILPQWSNSALALLMRRNWAAVRSATADAADVVAPEHRLLLLWMCWFIIEKAFIEWPNRTKTDFPFTTTATPAIVFVDTAGRPSSSTATINSHTSSLVISTTRSSQWIGIRPLQEALEVVVEMMMGQ